MDTSGVEQPGGRTDCWTSYPVCHGFDELKSLVLVGRSVYATVSSDTEQQLRTEANLEGWRATRAWTAPDGKTDALLIVVDSLARGEC